MGWIFIGIAILYFLLTFVLDVPFLRGHWIGNGVKVSRVGDLAWTLAIASWSVPFMSMESSGKVAPIGMLAILMGFIIVFAAGLYDSRRNRKR